MLRRLIKLMEVAIFVLGTVFLYKAQGTIGVVIFAGYAIAFMLIVYVYNTVIAGLMHDMFPKQYDKYYAKLHIKDFKGTEYLKTCVIDLLFILVTWLILKFA